MRWGFGGRVLAPGVLLGASLASVGCAPNTAALTPPVMYAPTHTAGIMFVVVRPRPNPTTKYPLHREPGSSLTASPSSEYILICDARPVDGMHCDLASEAALSRYSYTAGEAKASAPIDEGVGTLGEWAAPSAAASASAAPPAAPPSPSVAPPSPPPTGGLK
jgi:hypothetical protein